VEGLCSAAVKEEAIEAKLRAVGEQWGQEAFAFADHKQRGGLILKVGGREMVGRCVLHAACGMRYAPCVQAAAAAAGSYMARVWLHSNSAPAGTVAVSSGQSLAVCSVALLPCPVTVPPASWRMPAPLPACLQPSDTSELMERLEDSLMVLGSMATNRYAAPFRAEVQAWIRCGVGARGVERK
jgi:hypothetical protein